MAYSYESLMVELAELAALHGTRTLMRHVHLARTRPQLFAGRFDLDLARGELTVDEAPLSPVQLLGTEATGVFTWAWANEQVPEALRAHVTALHRNTAQQAPALQLPQVPLPAAEPGAPCSGFSLAATAAGILGHAAVVSLKDPQADLWLYVGLTSPSLHEQAAANPIARIRERYPLVVAMNAVHPRRGGLRIVDPWLPAIGLAIELGVAHEVTEEGTLRLQHGTRTLVAAPGAQGWLDFTAADPS